MSIFTSFLGFLHSLFNKVRPGLETFLHDHQDQITAIVKATAAKFEGMPLAQWRDEVFKDVQAAEASFANQPGTWLTIAINLGYDILKAGNA